MIMVDYDRSNNAGRPASTHYSPAHVGSPHLQSLDRPSAHSTPLQSPSLQYAGLPQLPQQHQQPPPSSISRPPTSYPTSAPYSPSMNAYHYPPQPSSQQLPRLGSPYSQPAAPSLPPLRSSFPPTHLPPLTSSHEGSPIPGSPIPQQGVPPPGPPMYGGYYTPPLPPPAHGHIASSPGHQPQRYPLPSTERIMSGGRHKKEIKRRTKTGCLTCRKRRIKCDEAHPTCKNCAKSKRDCLGYDPIFKPQQGPAAIQPAPTSGVSAPPPGTYGMPLPSMPAYAPISTTASSPASSCDTYDYPPVDPALDAATSHPQTLPPPILDSAHRSDLKRPLDRTSPYSSASETTRPAYTPAPQSYAPQLPPSDTPNGSHAKRIKIDDLLSVGSGSAPPLSPPSSEQATGVPSVESLKTIYSSRFAPALDGFLETRWFSNTGYQKLWTDPQLAEDMASVFERLKMRGGSYVEEEDPMIQRRGMHSDLLWAAVKMCYGTRIPISDNRRHDHTQEERTAGSAADMEAMEALRRINIVEALLVGSPDNTPPSPCPVLGSPRDESSPNYFWNVLEDISRFKNTGVESEKKLQHMLDKADAATNGQQNRRVLVWIGEIGKGGATEERQKTIRDYLENLANDHAQSMNVLEPRISGRAVGLWKTPVTETPCCMPAV